jgi:uridine kinase
MASEARTNGKRIAAGFDEGTVKLLAERITEARQRTPSNRAGLVAISGIDGCGKGYVASRLSEALQAANLRVALIGIDGWLNLPQQRFDPDDPAGHFYEHALRFDEMFAQLILPLRDSRFVRLEAELAEETAHEYHKHIYDFSDIDVILLEGIYLLKRAFAGYYDLSIWVDCTFETALERALKRAQEGLPPDATAEAYRTIYFPAQRIHFDRDNPVAAASIAIGNDERLKA